MGYVQEPSRSSSYCKIWWKERICMQEVLGWTHGLWTIPTSLKLVPGKEQIFLPWLWLPSSQAVFEKQTTFCLWGRKKWERMLWKVGSEDYHTAALPAQKCFSAMITTALWVKPFPDGAWSNCAAGLGKWRTDVGLGMGLGRRISFPLTENGTLQTSLVDVLKLCEGAPWCILGVTNSRWDTGGDLCHQADQTPCYLVRAAEQVGDLHGGCGTSEECVTQSAENIHSHLFPLIWGMSARASTLGEAQAMWHCGSRMWSPELNSEGK